MFECFCKKHGETGRLLAIRSLQFFGDARNEPDPVILNDWVWEVVENTFGPLGAELST